MSSQEFSVPFGRGSIAFRLPDGLVGRVAESRTGRPLLEPAAEIAAAVAVPHAGLPLRELARGKRRVCIAVTDATRACPDHLLVPPLLSEPPLPFRHNTA